jgi:hypothetical protein
MASIQFRNNSIVYKIKTITFCSHTFNFYIVTACLHLRGAALLREGLCPSQHKHTLTHTVQTHILFENMTKRLQCQYSVSCFLSNNNSWFWIWLLVFNICHVLLDKRALWLLQLTVCVAAIVGVSIVQIPLGSGCVQVCNVSSLQVWPQMSPRTSPTQRRGQYSLPLLPSSCPLPIFSNPVNTPEWEYIQPPNLDS